MIDLKPNKEEMKVVYVSNGTRVTVSNRSNRPFFQAIHTLNTKHSEVKMDIFDFLNTASKPARNLFTEIKCEMDYETNEAVICKPESKVKSNRVSKAYLELSKSGIVARIRPNAFMVNPDIIQPSNDKNYINSCKKWKILNS